MKQELLIGCGTSREKKLAKEGDKFEFGEGLITLDINPDRKPDVIWDLNNLPLPFEDSIFDEIHAYHVLEHLGSQGDYKQFFGFFEELWRISKHMGYFLGIVPHWKSHWVYGDPSHTRLVHPYQFNFLSQKYMKNEVERGSQASDFRYMYKGNWEAVKVFPSDDEENTYIILAAIK